MNRDESSYSARAHAARAHRGVDVVDAIGDGPLGGFLDAAYAEVILIEHALRQGRAAVVAASAGRLATAAGSIGAGGVAAIAADVAARARAGDLTIVSHILASLEEAVMRIVAAAPTPEADGPGPSGRNLPSARDGASQLSPRAQATAQDNCPASPPASARVPGVSPCAVLGDRGTSSSARDLYAALVAAAIGVCGLVACACFPGQLGGPAVVATAGLSASALVRLGLGVSGRAHTAGARCRGGGQRGTAEPRHRLLFERNPQPLWVYDRATLEIVAVSDAAVDVYGYSREEFLAMKIAELRPAEDVGSLMGYLETAAGREQLGVTPWRPWRHQYKDGTVVDVEVTSDDLVLDGRECRIVLSQDVTERNRANIELACARDAALEASRIKSAFLANMSHEIRTPMNGVIGMNELLLETALDEDQRYLAEQVASSGAQLLTIIDDILDISRIEACRFELHETEFDLHKLVSQVCVAARAHATANGLTLEQRIDEAVPRLVHGDDQRVRKVLSNLVSNAVKFTSAGSVEVRVRSRRIHGGNEALIRVEVADTGVGIDPRELEGMFEAFVQADASTTRSFGGTGLGLAIARELVDLMGGTMGARSALGQGSLFWFELRLDVTGSPGPRAEAGPGAQAGLARSKGPLALVPDDGRRAEIAARRSDGPRDASGGRARRRRASAPTRRRLRVFVGDREGGSDARRSMLRGGATTTRREPPCGPQRCTDWCDGGIGGWLMLPLRRPAWTLHPRRLNAVSVRRRPVGSSRRAGLARDGRAHVPGRTGRSRSVLLRRAAVIAVACGVLAAPVMHAAAAASRGTEAAAGDMHGRGRAVRPPRAHAAVIGGAPAAVGTWPWLAFVGNLQTGAACSGSVISPMVVLTAAHCAEDVSTGTPYPASAFRVVTGSVDWTDAAARTVLDVAQVDVNPGFSPTTLSDDVALLVLSTPTQAPALALATAQDSSLIDPGTVVEVAGWGETSAGADPPTTLNWGSTVVQSASYCSTNEYLDSVPFNPADAICAVDSPSFAVATCHGDSGGPLVAAASSGSPVEIGVTSRGDPSCDPHYPSVFEMVAPISGWAEQLIAANPSLPAAAPPPAPTTAPAASEAQTAQSVASPQTPEAASLGLARPAAPMVGLYDGRTSQSRGRVAFAVGANGTSVTHLKFAFVSRCSHGRSETGHWTLASPLPLTARDGAWTFSIRGVEERGWRYTVSGSLRSATFEGTFAATRASGDCTTGVVPWAARATGSSDRP